MDKDADATDNFIAIIAQESKTLLSIDEIREIIGSTEDRVLDEEQIEIPITNYFSKDVYAREMKVKKGTVLIGKIHRFENLNILSQGEVSVFSIDGCLRVKAPFTIVASAGAKRVFYAHSDCVWTTIHGTSETDVDKIEDAFIAKDYNDQIDHKEIKSITKE